MWAPTDMRNKQPEPVTTETVQLFMDKKQEQRSVTWMTSQGHFRVLNMSNTFNVLLHTTRTACVALTLLSFITAEIPNTRAGNQVPPGKGSMEPAPLALDAILKHIFQSVKHSISKFTSAVFGKAGTLLSCPGYSHRLSESDRHWDTWEYASMHTNCSVFKTEQGQHICLRVEICLCWALFHESQVSVTDLRQILQFTGKKWGHRYIVRYWRRGAFITRWLSLWSLGFLCPFCFGPFSVPAGLSLVCFLLQLALKRWH